MRLVLRIVAALGLFCGLALAGLALFLQGLEYGAPVAALACSAAGIAWFLLFRFVAGRV